MPTTFAFSLISHLERWATGPALVKAHQKLDKDVDLCYRSQAFKAEAKRMEFLFALYEKYTAGLFAKKKVKRKRAKG